MRTSASAALRAPIAASATASAANGPSVEIADLSFRYGAREVFRGVSFAVRGGEVFGVLGPNGAGKSTLFQLLVGLHRFGGGELRIDGRACAPQDRALRARTGVVFQSSSVDARLSARENLRLSAAVYRVPAATARARIDALLSFADISDRADEPVRRFSGGMRRRLEICRALVHAPDLLILDEPTAGLDEASFQRFWRALHALRASGGLTVLVTTHRPEEAEECDRLAILDGGTIVASDTPAALRAQVSGDVIVVEGDNPDEIASVVRERFGLEPLVRGREVSLQAPRGHELVPRLVEAFAPGRLRAVNLHRPSLADAFLRLTGRALADEVRAP